MNKSIPICDECGEPCTPILITDLHEYPDRDANGMFSSMPYEAWVSDCCEADYELEELDHDRE